jgi:hypothetical protein
MLYAFFDRFTQSNKSTAKIVPNIALNIEGLDGNIDSLGAYVPFIKYEISKLCEAYSRLGCIIHTVDMEYLSCI